MPSFIPAASSLFGAQGLSPFSGGPEVTTVTQSSNPEFHVGSPFAVGSGATATVPNAFGASGAIDSIVGAAIPLLIIGGLLIWALRR